MNRFRPMLSSLLITAIICAAPLEIRAQTPIGTVHGTVVNVSDGDHLTVDTDGTDIFVRLYGIDAPEISKVRRGQSKDEHGQPFAGRAFMELSNKVLHRQVTLGIMKKIDHHERIIAVVLLEDRNINLEMVGEGWAWASRASRSRLDDPEYREAEEKARSARAGLWSQPDPVPPWEFRKERKMADLDNW